MKCETCNKTSDNEDDFAYPFAHEPDYCWDCFEKLQYKYHGLYDDEIFQVLELKDEKSQLSKYKEILEREESRHQLAEEESK